jgi:hypothetical protein
VVGFFNADLFFLQTTTNTLQLLQTNLFSRTVSPPSKYLKSSIKYCSQDMAETFDYSNRCVVIHHGIIYYLPNCTCPVVIPPCPVFFPDPFRQSCLNSSMFKQPVHALIDLKHVASGPENVGPAYGNSSLCSQEITARPHPPTTSKFFGLEIVVQLTNLV